MIDALPLLLGPEGYQISRSVRLRSSASAYLNRTFAGSGTDLKRWTVSFWMKRGALGVQSIPFSSQDTPGTGASSLYFIISSSNTIGVFYPNTGSVLNVGTSAVLRDPSAWYHIVFSWDSTQATSTDRIKIYINGVQQTLAAGGTYPSLNATTTWNSNCAHFISKNPVSSSDYFDGYITEINSIDGQALTPASFGETNAVTGVWQPKKYAGTYGTNGFYLNFSDNSAATAAAIGKDNSGNGNNWTPNNISVTAGVTYDSMLDVPTLWADGGNGRGNYATLNPLDVSSVAFTNGNLTGTAPSAHVGSRATMAIPTTGKYYWEATTNSNVTGGNEFLCGVANSTTSLTAWLPASVWGGYGPGGPNVFSNTAFGATYSPMPSMVAGVVWQIAYDAATQNIWIGYNNVWYTSAGANTGSPSAGTGQTATASGTVYPYFEAYNLVFNINFGQRPFAYTPPSGFKALNTLNLPTPTILKGNQYFDAVTYAGSASQQTITTSLTGLDLAWIKNRTTARDHVLVDTVRGGSPLLTLYSDLTAAEDNSSPNYNPTSFTTSGIVLGGAKLGINNAGENFVLWGWKEGATQGFDIVTWTQANPSTLNHSLGVKPAMIIIKGRGTTDNWVVWHQNLTNQTTYALQLNTTTAQFSSASLFNSTAPTSTQFTVGTGSVTNGTLAVAYLFAAVSGYSAFGSYTGNGSADGPMIFTGFLPRWLMWKRSDSTGSWFIYDSARGTTNVMGPELYAESSAAEATATRIDFLSNGFKLRAANAGDNANGATYVYACFASNPFKNSLAR